MGVSVSRGIPVFLRNVAALLGCFALGGCAKGPHGIAVNGARIGSEIQSIGGVWEGTDSLGHSVIALVDEAGEFHLIRDDGVQYAGKADITGSSVSARVEQFGGFGAAVSGGTKYETLLLSGTVQAHLLLTVTVRSIATVNATLPDRIELKFNPIYAMPSSLGTFAGHYTDTASGDAITVTGNGAVFWQDPSTGCLAQGTVSTIEASHNLYEVQFSYSNCQGRSTELDGVQFSGLATLDASMDPERAIIGVTGQARGSGYAISLKLDRQPPRSPI